MRNVANQKQTQNHTADKVCSCPHCILIDVIFGDPLLTPWEREFINSVEELGWEHDYSPKQKAVIEKIHARLYAERIKNHEQTRSNHPM